MFELTLAEVAQITGGTLNGDPNLKVSSVTTDSREVVTGSLFAAIVGERVDGHDFVDQALASGGIASLVSQPVSGSFVLVPTIDPKLDPVVVALGKLSAEYRSRFDGVNVIGITGSSGKTSTKDIIGQVLASHAPTIAPPGSPNNELGLPLTILSAPLETKNLVLEMGMRGLGHIKYLCDIAVPNIAVVTNVGQAHIGEVGSIENIQKAKAEIVQNLTADNWAVLNFDDPNVIKMKIDTKAQVVTYGFGAGADVRAENLKSDETGTYLFDLVYGGEKYQVSLPLLGEHNVLNALAAFSVGTICAMTPAEICLALSKVQLKSPWRMERQLLDSGITIINDAYNANPESMATALRTLSGLASPGHSWAILGEMAELGEYSVEQHDAIGRLAVRLDISHLVVIGDAAKTMYLGALQEGSFDGEAVWFPDFDSAYDYIVTGAKAPDVLLFKASRVGRFEQLAQRISSALGNEVK